MKQLVVYTINLIKMETTFDILGLFSLRLEFVLIILSLYLLYIYVFNYHLVIMKGDYDKKLKNIGRTLPPYPNGWFIVAKSKDLKVGESMAIDQSGHNITIFRATNKKVHALHSYCAHLGANLGIGGKVVNDQCIQCPFHGWLYDGETGLCVDHDNKPAKVLNFEYNDQMGQKGCESVSWKKGKEGNVKLRKYPTQQIHGFIYIWLHVDENKQPEFQVPNVQAWQKTLNNRGFTEHTIYCHTQDIPENGADVYHFKYVHRYPIEQIKCIQFLWTPRWMTGDNPDLPQLFEHSNPKIREFKQGIYNNIVKNHKNKEYLSFANIDNYLILPILGKFFIFNLTVVQMGPGLVYVFLKSPIFTILFIQYVKTKQKYKQVLYHEMFASNWLPYWLTAAMLKGEGVQVYNDLLVWDSKKFGHNFHCKDNEADNFIINWRTWFSKYYQGCTVDGKLNKEEGGGYHNVNW